MLVFGSVYIVLEAADGRLCLCSSFGQTVHGLMCGARVHGVAWVHGGVMVVGNSLWEGCFYDSVPSPVAYLWGKWKEVGELWVLCDYVPVFGEEVSEVGEVWGVGGN